MKFEPSSDEQAAQAITRLVDGTLSDGERAAVEAWAAADPEVTRQVAAQRRVVQLLEAAAPALPPDLQGSVEQRLQSRRRSSPRPGAGRSGPARRARPSWLSLAPVGALAAAAAVLVIVLAGGAGQAPSIDAAAKLAFVPATRPAPAVASAKYLDVSYHGVTFPNYATLHATPTGQLTNTIGGRAALTVFYRLSNGARLSYTVFSGRPVPLPAAARLVRYQGVQLRVYRMRDGISVVTLVRHGRTCVLAARTAKDVVLGLAAEPVLTEHV